jgi:hypothetical protein
VCCWGVLHLGGESGAELPGSSLHQSGLTDALVGGALAALRPSGCLVCAAWQGLCSGLISLSCVLCRELEQLIACYVSCEEPGQTENLLTALVENKKQENYGCQRKRVQINFFCKRSG